MMSAYMDIAKKLEANLRESQKIQERRALLTMEAPGRTISSAFIPVRQGYTGPEPKKPTFSDISLLSLSRSQDVRSSPDPSAAGIARMLLSQADLSYSHTSQPSLLNCQEVLSKSQDSLKFLASTCTSGSELSPLKGPELWKLSTATATSLPNLPPPAETFPFKLHRMLRETEEAGKQSIASFSPCGNYFYIHDTEAFTKSIIPNYFVTLRLTSFQRQLNLYGFTRVSHGSHKHCYYNPFFHRDIPQLCGRIKRKPQTSVKRQDRNKARSKDSSP